MDVKELEAINGMSVQSDEEEIISIKKGAWCSQEDSILINYIAIHGEGRWNHLARNSGLKRTGKSCRLRWKNYLRPNVRRGNLTLEEQLRIIELHCFYGNRWSKIAEFLPGRTDNEIKNYWRTIVQKQAKQLKCDINSIEFREFIRNIWLPRLSEQIHASKSQSANNFDDMIINFEGVETNGPEPEMDYWASLSGALSSEPVEINPVSVVQHNLSKSDCWFSTFTYGLDCGDQDYFLSPFVSYGSFHGIDSAPACFSSGELSDTLLRDKYFWHCP